MTFGIYSLYSFGFDLCDFYEENRPIDAAPLSFLTGAAATLLAMAVWRVGRRAFRLKSARAYRTLLRTLWAHPDVRAKLGEDVRAKTIQRMQRYGRNHAWERAALVTPAASSSSTSSSATAAATRAVPPHLVRELDPPICAPNLRLVTYIPARFSSRPERDAWARWWLSRRLQFLVALHGSRGSGIASAEIEMPLRSEADYTNLLVLDVLQRGEQVALVKRTDGAATSEQSKSRLMESSDEKRGDGVMRERGELLSTKIRTS